MKLKENLKEISKYILLVVIGIFTYWGLNNIGLIFSVLKTIFNVMYPFILGGILAFILNIPTKKIESFLKKKINNKYIRKYIRIISIVLSLLIFIMIIMFIAFLLIPEFIENIKLLMSNIPGVLDKIQTFILDLLNKYPDVQVQIKNMFSESGNLSGILSSVLNYFINGSIGFISNLVSSVIAIFTALIFAIYMLCQKEYLISVSKKIIYSLFKKNRGDKLLSIGTLINKTFSNFVSGQCVEAIILGIILFVVSVIFRFPYALIIAMLTTVTALIPFVGAFISMAVGAILIGISNPIQALIFIIVFLVVQQIEGNLIYPKVVGKSVGLSPMWTLLAITVGGSLFGIFGMFLGLPLASVVYVLVKEKINNRLKEREINI